MEVNYILCDASIIGDAAGADGNGGLEVVQCSPTVLVSGPSQDINTKRREGQTARESQTYNR